MTRDYQEAAKAMEKIESKAKIVREGGTSGRRSLPADHINLAAPRIMDNDRNVAARPSRRAAAACHAGSPKGRPRPTDSRNAATSASVPKRSSR